jgi:two-component system sensor histidine kinase MtrB
MAAEVLHEARDEFDPVAARSAELLQNEVDRFEALLTDLLEISRFDAGAAVLTVETIDLREVVARVVEANARFADSTGTLVTVHAPVPCTAEVDARRIERILRNLLVNAIEHGEGRPIDIWMDADDAAVAIAVRDHGVGFEATQSSQVFLRFWRGDPARARTIGGTGLGLAISMEDANLHGGWLTAWGRPGLGAQFRLTLPRRAGDILQQSPLPMVPRDLIVPSPSRVEGSARQEALTRIEGAARVEVPTWPDRSATVPSSALTAANIEANDPKQPLTPSGTESSGGPR